MVAGGHGQQSTSECIDFLAQAFPRLSRMMIADVLKECSYEVGESLNVLEDLAQGTTSAQTDVDGQANDGKPSMCTSSSTRQTGEGWQVVAGGNKSFAQTLKEGKPVTLRSHSHTTRKNKNNGRGHRKWWKKVDETNVLSSFLSNTRRKALARDKGTQPSQQMAQASKTEDQKGKGKANSQGLNEQVEVDRLNFLTDLFGGELAPSIIMDVLEFCAQDTERAMQILMRMLDTPVGGHLEGQMKTDAFGEDSERDARMQGVKRLQGSFPQVEKNVLMNVIDAAAGDLKEAHTLLCLEYEEHKGEEQDLPMPMPMENMAPECGTTAVNQHAGVSASWTEVVNHSKHKKLVKDLHTLFPDSDGEFLEDVYMSMEKDMNKTIEYLTQSMNLVMVSKTSEVLPNKSSILPKQAAGSSSRSNSKGSSEEETHYSEYRQKAQQFDAMMRTCFEQASLAFSSGNGKAAKELSNQGKQCLMQRNEWRRKAAEQTCAKLNSERTSYFPLDMHGLRVDEGLQILTELLRSLSKVPGKKTLHVITGKGKHSQGGVSKMKSSIEAFLTERSLYYTVPDHNPGELYIHLDGGSKYITKL